jgi:hypothetical protein
MASPSRYGVRKIRNAVKAVIASAKKPPPASHPPPPLPAFTEERHAVPRESHPVHADNELFEFLKGRFF